MYERKTKKQAEQIAEQEFLINNLQNHIGISMKGRFEDRMNEREAYEMRRRVQDFDDPYRLMTTSKAFDFYSKMIIVAGSEEDKFI
jgi:hypothetical protein